MGAGKWTFLSNHGRVFLYLARNSSSTTEKISRDVGLSLRGVQKIIAEMEEDGYVTHQKVGRCNHYIVHPDKPMRHRLEQNHTVGDILLGLDDNNPS